MSRPVSNLERMLSSVNFQEDEVVVTPEPTLVEQLSNSPHLGVKMLEVPVSDCLSSRSCSPLSDEDVPLTVELLTPRVRVNSIPGFGKFGLEPMPAKGSIETQSNEECEKHPPKRQMYLNSSRLPPKKNSLPFKLPASSESLLEEYGVTTDGIDDYQERERDNRIVRLKRKTKKRQGEFKNKMKKQGDDAN